MTRVPTIMVTYAELHKLRVVISSRGNKRHKQRRQIGRLCPFSQEFLIPLEEYTNSFCDNQPGSFKVHASVTF